MREGRSASRQYVILEEITLDDGETGWVVATTVEARNPQNALRAGFKAMRANGYTGTETRLAAVAESMFQPTLVRANVQERVTVAA